MKEEIIRLLEEQRKNRKLAKKAVPLAWYENFQDTTNTEEYKPAYLVKTYSNLINLVPDGWDFFFKNQERRDSLYKALEFSSEDTAKIEAMLVEVPKCRQICIAGFMWNLDLKKIIELEKLIKKNPKDNFFLYCLETDRMQLPYVFQDNKNFTCFGFKTKEEASTAIQKVQKKHLVVLSPHQCVDYRHWCVCDFEDNTLYYWNHETRQKQLHFPSHASFPAPQKVTPSLRALELDTIIHEKILSWPIFKGTCLEDFLPEPYHHTSYHQPKYRTGSNSIFDQYQQKFDLVDPNNAQHYSLKERYDLCQTLQCDAFCTTEEQKLTEYAKLVLHIVNNKENGIDSQQLIHNHLQYRYTPKDLKEAKETAHRIPHQEILILKDAIHFINCDVPKAIQGNSHIKKHTITPRRPAISVLWEHLASLDYDAFQEDWQISNLISKIENMGYPRKEVLDAQRTIYRTDDLTSGLRAKWIESRIPAIKILQDLISAPAPVVSFALNQEYGRSSAKQEKKWMLNRDWIRVTREERPTNEKTIKELLTPAMEKNWLLSLNRPNQQNHHSPTLYFHTSSKDENEERWRTYDREFTYFWLALQNSIQENQYVVDSYNDTLIQLTDGIYARIASYPSSVQRENTTAGILVHNNQIHTSRIGFSERVAPLQLIITGNLFLICITFENSNYE